MKRRIWWAIFLIVGITGWVASLEAASRYYFQDLGTLGGKWSTATGINAGGQIVGGAHISSGLRHAFFKNPGQPMEDLGTLDGAQSTAFGINASGQIVGEANTSNARHPFLKNPGQPLQDLGTLGGTTSSANGINAGGQIVGWSFISDDTATNAFLQNPGEPMQNLNALVVNLPSTIYLIGALAINDRGWIVGWTSKFPDMSHAFLLTPISPISGSDPLLLLLSE